MTSPEEGDLSASAVFHKGTLVCSEQFKLIKIQRGAFLLSCQVLGFLFQRFACVYAFNDIRHNHPMSRGGWRAQGRWESWSSTRVAPKWVKNRVTFRANLRFQWKCCSVCFVTPTDSLFGWNLSLFYEDIELTSFVFRYHGLLHYCKFLILLSHDSNSLISIYIS